MSTKKFQSVALISRNGIPGAEETLRNLHAYFSSNKVDHVFAQSIDNMLPDNCYIVSDDKLYEHADLLIVVGGDGSLLNAAHIALQGNMPVLGINRGRLGFLTDIHPDDLGQLDAILQGDYVSEQRFLLSATSSCNNSPLLGLNEIVLLPSGIAQMIVFDVYVNDQLLYAQRADGLILATPTGSTAYALSGGGPILQPELNAIAVVPMFPHTLSSRPIVLDGNSEIRIDISPTNAKPPCLSNDGREQIRLDVGSSVTIKQHTQKLTLIHPLSYNYYNTLQEKLHWEKHAEREHH